MLHLIIDFFRLWWSTFKKNHWCKVATLATLVSGYLAATWVDIPTIWVCWLATLACLISAIAVLGFMVQEATLDR